MQEATSIGSDISEMLRVVAMPEANPNSVCLDDNMAEAIQLECVCKI
jgi:hypothetical protein